MGVLGYGYCILWVSSGTCIINHGGSWAWTRQLPWYLPCDRAVCAVAFVACVNAHKNCVMFLILLQRLCTGMDEARALVHASSKNSVSRVSSPLLRASMVTNIMFCSLFYYISCAQASTSHTPWYMPYAIAVCLVCCGLCYMGQC